LFSGFHLFFDEFLSTPEIQNPENVDIKDLVGLIAEYPNQTVWLSMRPDSYQCKTPGFQVVKLKANFRNSPKILQGAKHFFQELKIFPGNFN
jgi:hypothetical protein